MNAGIVFLVLATALAVAFASGSGETDGLQPGTTKVDDSRSIWDVVGAGARKEKKVRVRRVTCDILSVSTMFGSFNHSACAAHCLAKKNGFKGGRCKDGVCHCRK